VTATPTTTAPGKRKSSGTIIVEGKESPIDITGLTFGVNYIFSVVAINAAGGSPPKVTVTPVTPCTLNTAVTQTPTIYLNRQINNLDPVSIAITTGATGIGTATGLPTGVTATWSNNVIRISGTPTEARTFNFTIPLTGGCGSVNATGTVTVVECNEVSILTQYETVVIVEIETPLIPINIETSGALGIQLPTDPLSPFRLPNGVIAILEGSIVKISGKPIEPGNFNFRFYVVGSCGPPREIMGTIIVQLP
jgi:hypothetical protein